MANELMQKNLKFSQGQMKQWYDKKARFYTFQPGDQVLGAVANSWPAIENMILQPIFHRTEG